MSTQTEGRQEAQATAPRAQTAAAAAGEPRRSPEPAQFAATARKRGRLTLLLLILVCAAPILISYFMYYVVKPHGASTSYGTLIDPQRPVPASLSVTDEAGRTMPLASLKGRWLMISVDSGACADACVQKLYFMRQVRATQGVDRGRVLTVWLRTDDAPVAAVLKTAYPDVRRLRADPSALAQWLPATATTSDTAHIYLVDPNGNLMMRFPAHPDPSKIKGDLTKLLKWSSIG